MAEIVDETHSVSTLTAVTYYSKKVVGKKRKAEEAFKTSTSSTSSTSFAIDVDSISRPISPIPEGTMRLDDDCDNFLSEYGVAKEDGVVHGDDAADNGDDVHDLSYEDDAGDCKEDTDEEYICHRSAFTWKFDDSSSNSDTDSDNYKPNSVEKDL